MDGASPIIVAPLGFQFRYLHLCNLLVLCYLGVIAIAWAD